MSGMKAKNPIGVGRSTWPGMPRRRRRAAERQIAGWVAAMLARAEAWRVTAVTPPFEVGAVDGARRFEAGNRTEVTIFLDLPAPKKLASRSTGRRRTCQTCAM